MKKTLPLIVLSLLALAGCETTDSKGSADPAVGNTIKTLEFNRPAQIKWDTVNQGKAIVYTPKGVDPQKTPIKFIYQQVKHNGTPEALAERVVKPIKDNCIKAVTSPFKTRSAYPNQKSYQTMCNQFKGAKYGMVNYVNIFTDADSSHVLIGEVKTPASKAPGKLDPPKNDAEKKVVQNTVAFIKLTQKAMTEVAACDDKGQCQ